MKPKILYQEVVTTREGLEPGAPFTAHHGQSFGAYEPYFFIGVKLVMFASGPEDVTVLFTSISGKHWREDGVNTRTLIDSNLPDCLKIRKAIATLDSLVTKHKQDFYLTAFDLAMYRMYQTDDAPKLRNRGNILIEPHKDKPLEDQYWQWLATASIEDVLKYVREEEARID